MNNQTMNVERCVERSEVCEQGGEVVEYKRREGKRRRGKKGKGEENNRWVSANIGFDHSGSGSLAAHMHTPDQEIKKDVQVRDFVLKGHSAQVHLRGAIGSG